MIHSIVVRDAHGDYVPEIQEWRLEGTTLIAGRPRGMGRNGDLERRYAADLTFSELHSIYKAAQTVPLSTTSSWVYVDFENTVRLSGVYECSIEIRSGDKVAWITTDFPIAEYQPLVDALNQFLPVGHKIPWRGRATGYTLTRGIHP